MFGAVLRINQTPKRLLLLWNQIGWFNINDQFLFAQQFLAKDTDKWGQTFAGAKQNYIRALQVGGDGGATGGESDRHIAGEDGQ